MFRLIKLVLLVYVGLIIVLYTLQTRLIFPGAATQGDPSAAVHPTPGAELVRLTTHGGDRVTALFGTALTPDGQPLADARTRPTLLFFYGNGMCLAYTLEEFEAFRRLGANVLVPDYIGYGLSSGEPSEAGCHATADAAYDYLLTRSDVDPRRIVASGWSLGGAVAVDLAVRRPVAGLAVFSTLTSMTEMVQRAMPFLPAGLLLHHKFDSLSKIGRVSCPILLGHGRGDSIVPHDMSERLADAARAPVTRFTIENADHNDFFLTERASTLDRLKTFLDGLELPES